MLEERSSTSNCSAVVRSIVVKVRLYMCVAPGFFVFVGIAVAGYYAAAAAVLLLFLNNLS